MSKEGIPAEVTGRAPRGLAAVGQDAAAVADPHVHHLTSWSPLNGCLSFPNHNNNDNDNTNRSENDNDNNNDNSNGNRI